MKVIYEKIYIGKDLTATVNYFGSVDSRLIQSDFTPEQSRDFTIRKEILWQSETATDREVNLKEVEFIRALRSNDPAVGYNRCRRQPGGRPRAASSVRRRRRSSSADAAFAPASV